MAWSRLPCVSVRYFVSRSCEREAAIAAFIAGVRNNSLAINALLAISCFVHPGPASAERHAPGVSRFRAKPARLARLEVPRLCTLMARTQTSAELPWALVASRSSDSAQERFSFDPEIT